MPSEKTNIPRRAYKSSTSKSSNKPMHHLHRDNKNNTFDKSKIIKPTASEDKTKEVSRNKQDKRDNQGNPIRSKSLITEQHKTPKTYTIDENTATQRLDNYLVKQCKGVPKTLFYRLLRTGAIRVNAKKQKPDYRIAIDDVITIPAITMTENDNKQEQLKAMILPTAMKKKQADIAVLFEDECLLVVNKPAGLAVHGGSGINWGLIELLRHERPQHQFLELVHRIDRDTSGVLVLAKKRSSLVHLHEQIRSHQIDKRYLALVKGKFPESPETLEYPLLKKTLENGERRVYVRSDGKEAKTKVTLDKIYTHEIAGHENIVFSLIHARIFTGRTHQIRVHCQHRGFPILGDEKYGDETTNTILNQKSIFKGMALHAHRFVCTHPKSEEKMIFELPFPDSWKKLMHQE